MFSTALFSQLFQHSVPGLIHPLPTHRKRSALSVFFVALSSTATSYILLGVLSVLYFGTNLFDGVNLNFKDFVWRYKASGAGPLTPSALDTAVDLFIVAFPALDTLSVFPLIAITLGNNLAAVQPLSNVGGFAISKSVSRIMFRLFASVPPILASLLFTDLSLTLQLSGVSGVYVAFIGPLLLQYFSAATVKRTLGTDHTVFSSVISGPLPMVAVGLFSLVALVMIIVQIGERLASPAPAASP